MAYCLTFVATQDVSLSYYGAFYCAARMMSLRSPYMHDDEDITVLWIYQNQFVTCSSFYCTCRLAFLSLVYFMGHGLIISLIQQAWSFEAAVLINKQRSESFILISNEKGTNCSNHSLKLGDVVKPTPSIYYCTFVQQCNIVE